MIPQDTDPLRAKGTDRQEDDEAMAVLREVWLRWPTSLPEDLLIRAERALGHHPLAGLVPRDPDPLRRPSYPGWSQAPGPLSRLVAWVRKWRRG